MLETEAKESEQKTDSNVLAEIKAQNEALQKQIKEQAELNKYTLENLNTLKESITKAPPSEDYDEEAEEKSRIMKVMQQVSAEQRKKREDDIVNVLSSEIPDFGTTFTKENIESLSKEKPQLKEMLDDMWDAGGKEKAAMHMYKAIKEFKSNIERSSEEAQDHITPEMAGGYSSQAYGNTRGSSAAAENVYRHVQWQPGDYLPPDSDFINPSPERKRKAYEKLVAIANGRYNK